MKHLLKITFSFLLIIFTLNASALSAQEGDGSGVNSTDMGLSLHGAAGYGNTLFGVISDTDDSGDLGAGPGGSFELGALFNYSILALGLNITQVYYNDTEIKYEGETFKTEGDGYYRTIEMLAGLKLFTEEDDMGYTLLYTGYKTWKADRSVDKVTVGGVSTDQFKSDYVVKGDGWLIGYRDLSTFDVFTFSIAFQTGLWYQYLPVSSIKSDGHKLDTKEDISSGFGFEAGIGAALEDMGLSVMASAKMDFNATILENSNGDNDVAGAGYLQYFLTVTKDFSI